MTPSASFVSLLHQLDPLLRVRWGNIIGQWVLDRKAYMMGNEVEFLARRLARARKISEARPTEKNINAFQGIAEEYISAKEQRRVIFFATKLDDNTYQQICASDIRRYGGYSRLADEIEATEAKQAAEKARIESQNNIDQWKDTYDVLAFLQRKRQSELLAGEKDLKKLLS